MATEKRGHTSRPAQYLSAENGDMGQNPSLIVLPCRDATVTPNFATIEQRLPNHQRKLPCHNRDIYRYKSGVLSFDRMSSQRISSTGMRRIIPSSANSHTVLSAPRGLVTYLQLCKPIIPRVRPNSTGLRSHNPYIHKPKEDDTLKHINLNTDLAVYGVPLGHLQPSSQNVAQRVEKIQIHVFLPRDQHQLEDKISSKFNSLTLQECKNPENDKMAIM
ncbi:uncharacterized protein LOC130357875 [Hyla sarda]|uniref:uncharacterized protein LOC130357875 n=1 Tax=Hyla sarda TaxID=327740 RepID=UPI0024C42DC5|nr:uncharacterized protein LOC130357875 [Hyla sarda]XP_056416596.1 uncharacterized protein LOC130357875 [Hyla sarda]